MITLIALAFAYPGKLLIVDRMIVGQLEGKTWKQISEKVKTDVPMTLSTIAWNKLGTPVEVKGFEPQPEVGGTFVNCDEPSIMVATYGLNPKFPRKVVPIDLKSPAYLAALAAYLKTVKVTTKARLTAAYRIDLDGDGTDEVLLEGANQGNSRDRTIDPKVGDYSCVLLRTIRKGKVVTKALMSNDNVNKNMSFCTLRAVVDLDGDGKMEVIVSDDYYEGQSASLFSFKAGKVKMLVETGAGV